jgi:hypothetical protein
MADPNPILIGPRFVIWSEIEDIHVNGFLPKGLNEYFFWKDHGLAIGDRVKITIQKVEAHADSKQLDHPGRVVPEA